MLPGSADRPGDVVGMLFGDAMQMLAVDVTVLHIQTPSSVNAAADTPGKGLAKKEQSKRSKYEARSLQQQIQFVPFAVDDFGHIGDAGQALLRQLALRSAVRGCDDFTEGGSVPERVAYKLKAWRARIAWAVHESMYHSIGGRLQASRGTFDGPPGGGVGD